MPLASDSEKRRLLPLSGGKRVRRSCASRPAFYERELVPLLSVQAGAFLDAKKRAAEATRFFVNHQRSEDSGESPFLDGVAKRSFPLVTHLVPLP